MDNMKKLNVGSDFSGVGAFDQALMRLQLDYNTIFSCDMDKFVRQTYIQNYGEPEYYPENVYNRAIPEDSLDIYMTSPPCQSFSIAGSRKGEDDDRGILFYNSHEFIQQNEPRSFIFENVKGLLSDDDGNTFAKWLQYLGGKSVNGLPTLFPHPESVPYHIYWTVLNAKNYNIPQNRERVFIVGIRDDDDNNFLWPKTMQLKKLLRDVIEKDVDPKYYLDDIDDSFISTINSTMIKVKSASKLGYEVARVGEDSINLDHPKSRTKRGRVGEGICQTLTTSCNHAVAIGSIIGRPVHNPKSRKSGMPTKQVLEIRQFDTSNTLTTVQKDNVVVDYDKLILRRLTPRECFRLMDFPESFTWPVSDNQAWKQAGNSICVGVLEGIINSILRGFKK